MHTFDLDKQAVYSDQYNQYGLVWAGLYWFKPANEQQTDQLGNVCVGDCFKEVFFCVCFVFFLKLVQRHKESA